MPMPGAYRSPMMRPLYVTTNASVIASGAPNPSSSARASIVASISFGSAVFGSISPIGHGVTAAGGSFDFTTSGVKNIESAPIGSGTQP